MTVSNLLWNCFELKEITVHLETDNGPVSVTWKTSNEELKDAGCVGAVVDLHDEDVLLEKINSIILVFQDTNRVYLCFERDRSYIRINLDPEWEVDTGVIIEKTIATRLGAILRQGIDGINEILDARDEFLLKYRPNGFDPEDVERERERLRVEKPSTSETEPKKSIQDDSLQLRWMGAIDKIADKNGEDEIIKQFKGPFVACPNCGVLAHMLPENWGFIPDEDDEFLECGGWWAIGVRDRLGRDIRIIMESSPDVDYESNQTEFTIYSATNLRTLADIQDLLNKYEPLIDHWWCHRAQPAVSESV